MGRDVRVVSSSGSKILDEEAVATVKRASPFHPVPKEISKSPIGMTVAIVFSLSKK
jgi:protein TonB